MRTTPQHRRGRGEKGIAIVMTALCLIPLMIFAAFGVDIASWYSRVSFLQKSADAAALAGTVWMPDLTESRLVACESLAKNGIVGTATSPHCSGSGDFTVVVERGSTPTSLRVTVTDPSADRYFSQVFRGEQSLSRGVEAEYNLPIPLGSPLNYFGGDRTTTDLPAVLSYSINWPSGANSSARPPAIAQVGDTQQAFNCAVGSDPVEGFGRWTGTATYQSTNSTAPQRCFYSVRFATAAGTTTVAPPDYSRRLPTNTPCNVFGSGNGRWTNATTFDATARYTSGTGNRQCTWTNVTTTERPSWYNTGNSPGSAPVNRPCRVGYSLADGWWGPGSSGAFSSPAPSSGGNNVNGTNQSAGNRLCRWQAAVVTTTVSPASNPIDVNRSPGFWAQIEGPDTISTNGDAFSPRCYDSNNCTDVENEQYELPGDVDRGYWYVVRMPGSNTGPVSIRVFDANHAQGNVDHIAGDRNLGAGGNFNTQFRVYHQTNPLDFTERTEFGSDVGDTTDESCHWDVPPATGTGTSTASPFKGVWRTLCVISTYTPGDLYLVNVTTSGDVGNGVNGYALEALTGSDPQPAVYAYADMGMYNVNRCSGAGCTPPPATFYLAEVGPQYAGKTLVLSLWDPGDVQDGDALMTVKMPSTAVPKPVQDVDPSDCSFTSSPSPNDEKASGELDPTGAVFDSPQPSEGADSCSIVTATDGARRFNGTWLTIRVTIPADYTCNLSTASTPVNPETTAGSCWWGIEYEFDEASQDVTVWSARIEGNPVHLTT